MGIKSVPGDVVTLDVSGVTFHLRRPNRSEMSHFIQVMDDFTENFRIADAKTADAIEEVAERANMVTAHAVSICARDEDSKSSSEPVLTVEESLQWLLKAQLEEGCLALNQTELAKKCMLLCGQARLLSGKVL